MKNKKIGYLGLVLLLCVLLAGCGSGDGQTVTTEETENSETIDSNAEESERENGEETDTAESGQESETPLPDGVYSAEFKTNHSMFHVNEADDGRGILTVEDGQMVIHVSLVSKNIVNLYMGKAEDAQKEGAELLEPTEDTVTYSDGYTEEVYGFDVPVPALDEEFDVALIGTKGKWYDHTVIVTDPEPIE